MPGNSKGTIEFDLLIYDEANGSLLVLQIENQSDSQNHRASKRYSLQHAILLL